MLLALTKQETVLRLESRHLKVSSEQSEAVAGTIPVNLLDRVILTESAQISGAVMQKFLEARLPVILLDKRGKYLGEFHFTPSGDSKRRRTQALFVPEENLLPAKKLLDAKLYNQKRLLQRLAANRHPALVLDLMEPFRPGYCDMLAVSLLTTSPFTA